MVQDKIQGTPNKNKLLLVTAMKHALGKVKKTDSSTILPTVFQKCDLTSFIMWVENAQRIESSGIFSELQVWKPGVKPQSVSSPLTLDKSLIPYPHEEVEWPLILAVK